MVRQSPKNGRTPPGGCGVVDNCDVWATGTIYMKLELCGCDNTGYRIKAHVTAKPTNENESPGGIDNDEVETPSILVGGVDTSNADYFSGNVSSNDTCDYWCFGMREDVAAKIYIDCLEEGESLTINYYCKPEGSSLGDPINETPITVTEPESNCIEIPAELEDKRFLIKITAPAGIVGTIDYKLKQVEN